MAQSKCNWMARRMTQGEKEVLGSPEKKEKAFKKAIRTKTKAPGELFREPKSIR